MLNKKKMNQKGFTLVELIIVIAILGILVALFVPRIMGNVEDARKKKEISNARTIVSEITAYNANEKTKSDDDANLLIPATGTKLTKTELKNADPSIARPEDEFPDDKVVEIHIDSEGNASLVIK